MAVCANCMAGEQGGNVSTNNIAPIKLRSVELFLKNQWLRLDILNGSAQQYLENRKCGFTNLNGYTINARIVATNNNQRIFLYYYGKLGEPYWMVSFDSNGKITNYETGTANDFAEDEK